MTTVKQPSKLSILFSTQRSLAMMKSPDYMMFDTGAVVHVCPLWLCGCYPAYEPYYGISFEWGFWGIIRVYGIIAGRMQLTSDPITVVYVQFVATYVHNQSDHTW